MFYRLALLFIICAILLPFGCSSDGESASETEDTLATSAADSPPAADYEALQGVENQMKFGQTTRLALPPVRNGEARFWTLERQDSSLVEHVDSALVMRHDTLFRFDIFKAIGVGRAHIHYAWRDTMMADSILQEDTTASYHIQIVKGQASL